MTLTPSATRYLLAIYQLSDGGHAVRSVDVSTELGVSRASVVKMLRRLVADGLINKKYYGNIQLTPEGVREANRIYTQFTILEHFFRFCLRVEEPVAKQDALACLSTLSQESLEQLTLLSLPQAGGVSPSLPPCMLPVLPLCLSGE